MNAIRNTIAAALVVGAAGVAYVSSIDIHCPDGAAYCEVAWVEPSCDHLCHRGGTASCEVDAGLAEQLACAKAEDGGVIESWECLLHIDDAGVQTARCSAQFKREDLDGVRKLLEPRGATNEEPIAGVATWAPPVPVLDGGSS